MHFDTKKFQSSKRHIKEKRVALVVSSGKKEHLLGVNLINDGKAETVTKAAAEIIEKYELNEKIIGLSFDTENVNTGETGGVCVLLEAQLNRKLVQLPCRHHVSEIICGDVFNTVFKRKTSGPDEVLFKDFCKAWDDIKYNSYSPCNDPLLEENEEIKRWKDETIRFIYERLQNDECLPRDDYLEFLELTLLFLGAIPPNGVRFRVPGACSHARYMGQAIYVLKIYLFREYFVLSEQEEAACLQFCLFITLIYVKYWTLSTKTVDAPINDLNLIKQLGKYATISMDISVIATNALHRHLSYLGEELAVFALFSDEVPNETKNKMRNVLQTVTPVQNVIRRSANSISYHLEANENLSTKNLEDFMAGASHNVFNILDLDTSFLAEDAALWTVNKSYIRAKEAIKKLNVVNDIAERAIGLAGTFNLCITKDETDRQLLYQKVHTNRKALPNCNKRNFM